MTSRISQIKNLIQHNEIVKEYTDLGDILLITKDIIANELEDQVNKVCDRPN
jgi:hypothetical protein